MLKREIKYRDFNDEEVTDVFYFNLSKPELVELELGENGGFAKMLERIIETKNGKDLVRQFKEIILMAYGEKSADGKRFVKTPEMRKEFEQHAAYEALFMELSTSDTAAAEFLKGVLPKDLTTETPATS